MKDTKTEMAFVTSYEKLIIENKIYLDTSKDKHKWSCNTYHCLVELIDSKVKCHCPPCEIVRHQINLQLRLVFTWTNQFKNDHTLCGDTDWNMCESIFSLIAQSHSNFTKNICNDCHEVDAFACATKLLNKEKEKEANTEGPGLIVFSAPNPAA
jgi:hypothetical protein